MNEAFIAYVWKLRLFNHQNLSTVKGEKLEILAVGTENKQGGPDFFNAKIKIGNTIWAGNVELHTLASDWLKHQHQHDAAYNNVILHVVYEGDTPICRKDGTPIPTLELRQRIPPKLYRNYLYLLSSKTWIPCEQLIAKIDPFTLKNWLDRLLIERLERKTAPILASLQSNHNNWEATFYQFLARAFGTKINALPFELLAKSLPISILSKHSNNLFQLEAFLFGQAGLLEKDFEEDYPKALKKEYYFLQKKFDLQPLKGHIWQFARLRPPNFPTIRIAQLAQLLHQSTHLFSKIINLQTVEDYQQLFAYVQVSPYWETHYIFDKKSKKSSKKIGKNTVNTFLINTIVPILFVYSKQRASNIHQARALQLLENLPKESNSIIQKWATLDIKAASAYDSQGLLQLKNEYCDAKKCLNCALGHQLLVRDS